MMQNQTINVMIVDPTAQREVLNSVLAGVSGLQVLHVAADAVTARRMLQQQWPDVLLLDLELPDGDGLRFLRQIMRERPTPTVICSSRTENSAQQTLQALAVGAVSVVTKPNRSAVGLLQTQVNELVAAIHSAASAPMTVYAPPPICVAADRWLPPVAAGEFVPPPTQLADRIVAIGTSTGGTEALEQLLPRLDMNCPPLAIVQHMPGTFTRRFAERLNDLSRIEVKEAANGDRLQPGRALIAPGGHHLVVRRSNGAYVAEILDGPPISRHRPSVDALFRSVARAAGRHALGVIMTGMGDDGARGLKEMRDAGANTVGQDEATCAVYGMPKEALRLGAVAHVAPLEQLDRWISRHGQ